MKKALLLLAGLAFAGTASAEGTSEYFQQPGAGAHQMQFDLKYSTKSVTYTPDVTTAVADQKQKTSLTTLWAEYGYGFNENYALNVALGYSSGSQTIDTTTAASTTTSSKVGISGLEDIQLNFLAVHAMGSGMLHWGVELDLAMGNYVVDSSGTDTTVNRSSGSTTLRPYIGYGMTKDSCSFGGRLSYDIVKTDTSTDSKTATTTTTTKTKGGAALMLSGFYEHNFTSWLLGGELRYVNQADFKTTTGTSTVSQYSPDAVRINIYSTFDLAENMALLANLETRLLKLEDKYMINAGASTLEGKETASSGFILGLGFRMMF